MSYPNHSNIEVAGVKILPHTAFSLDSMAHMEVRDNRRNEWPRTDFFIHKTAHTMSMAYRSLNKKTGKPLSWNHRVFTMKTGDPKKVREFEAQYWAAVTYFNDRTGFYKENPTAEFESGW